MSIQNNLDDLSFYDFKHEDNVASIVKDTDRLCSTPRQSADVKANDMNDYSCDLLRSSKIDFTNNDDDDDEAEEHTDVDDDADNNTLDSLGESLNFNEKNNNRSILNENKNCKPLLSARSTSTNGMTKRFLLQLPSSSSAVSVTQQHQPSSYYYKMPINQMQNVLSSLRKNFLNQTPINMNTNQKNIIQKLEESEVDNQESDDFDFNNNLHLQNDDDDDDGDDDGGDNKQTKIELEQEKLKRQHCEKQIHELNQKILSLEQNIAVLTASDRKKEAFIQKLDKSLTKTLNAWKQKENDTQIIINKLENDKVIATTNESNCINRVRFLEDEMRQLNADLVNEKVKFQEYQREKTNEINKLKSEYSDLQKSDYEKTTKLESFQNQITLYRDEKDNLEQKVSSISRKFEENKSKYEEKEIDNQKKINTLMKSNEQLCTQYNTIQVEYEKLIKEAKMVVEESEKQYQQLIGNIETEKRTKDALLVEISILEEKLDSTVKVLKNENEEKIKVLENKFAEKEKFLFEKHKSEIDELMMKQSIAFEALDRKYKNESELKILDYDEKTKFLNKKVDSLQNEVNILNEQNKSLEYDRNKLRENLKQMFELQMKEAMQLLGLSSNICNNVDIKNVEVKQCEKIMPHFESNKNLKDDGYVTSSDHVNSQSYSTISEIKDDKCQSYDFDNNKLNSNNEPSYSINDLFLKYQVDLIDNCYNYDKLTSKHETERLQQNTSHSSSIGSGVISSLSNTSMNTSTHQQMSASKEYESKNDDLSLKYDLKSSQSNLNNSRSSELRHFIEMLLDKTPNETSQNVLPSSTRLSVTTKTSLENKISFNHDVVSAFEPIVNVNNIGFKPIVLDTNDHHANSYNYDDDYLTQHTESDVDDDIDDDYSKKSTKQNVQPKIQIIKNNEPIKPQRSCSASASLLKTSLSFSGLSLKDTSNGFVKCTNKTQKRVWK